MGEVFTSTAIPFSSAHLMTSNRPDMAAVCKTVSPLTDGSSREPFDSSRSATAAGA